MLALVTTVVGHLFALAAAHTRVSMQVLARDPRIPPDVSADVKRMTRYVLGPTGDPRAARAGAVTDDDSSAPGMLVGSALPACDALAGHTAVRVTVVIPAHNEELILPAAVESLRAQTRPPDRVIVVSDNSEDATVGTPAASASRWSRL